MRISIYQIIPELDQNRLLFMPFSHFKKAGYETPPSQIYRRVFHGDIKANTCEEIYRIFNRIDEEDCQYLERIGFTGHSLSVSDIIELHGSSGNSRFYFCDTFGFQEIKFQKE